MYTQQIERAKRYYARFERINDGIVDGGLTSDEHIDDMHAFFNACYHIKDYLINDPTFTKFTKQQIENHINATFALQLCADICNGLKHMKLTHARSGNAPSFGKRTFNVSFEDNFAEGTSRQSLAIKLEIVHNGTSYDAFSVATDAMSAWDKFL